MGVPQETDKPGKFNLETEMDKVIKAFHATVGFDNAELAINIISYHMNNTVISPSSRSYYKGKAPLRLSLEGDEKFLNSIFIQKIKELLSSTDMKAN